jgi:16S rRNA G966 N2-methylase RsmD
MNVFEKYPQFISTDPRTNRTGAYSVSAGFMQVRHECLFGPTSLKDKTVLDLGSCVAATGAWVLAHGAKFYCGIEYHKDLTGIAEKNLTAFDSSRWQIVNQSVEDFFKTNAKKYDIVIASGLLYAFFEPIPILKHIANCADTIIIESAHPYNHNKPSVLTEQQMNSVRCSPEWLQFIETEPFISYRRQSMLWGTDGEELIFNSSVPSMGFVIQYMKTIGFEYDPSVNDSLKNRLPDVYNANRFGIKLLKKTDNRLSTGFLSATEFKSDVVVRNWNNL